MSKIRNLKKISLPKANIKFSLFLITFFSLIAYLPLIPFMGFFREDFFFSYVGHFYGLDGLINSLSIDRPFNGYLLSLSYSFLGDSVFYWHISTFFLRLFGGYFLFVLLFQIWPKKLFTITSITLLFLLYPGFFEQTIPLGYQVYPIGLLVWILSVIFTILAIRSSKRIKFLYLATALFLQVISFVNLEFFIGQETLRILIIAYLSKGKKISFESTKKTYIIWGPYLISIILFTFWRIFLFKSTREVTSVTWVSNNYYSNPIWVLKIPLELLHSLMHTLIFPYFLPIAINFIRLPFFYSTLAVLMGIGSAVLLHFSLDKITDDLSNKKIGKSILLIGLITVTSALFVIIISGRYVRLFNTFDRYTITSMISVSFIIVGFFLLKSNYKIQKLVIVFLVGISITSHLMNGFWHKEIWDKQQNLWWQLYWRAPNIEKNAMLILDFPSSTNDMIFKDIINKVKWYRFYWAEEQIWASGNLFFNYDNPPKNHFRGDFLLDDNIPEKIKDGVVEPTENRKMAYTRDFRNTVIIRTPGDLSCLWVLSESNLELPKNANEHNRIYIHYSDTDKLIKKDYSVNPPVSIFGEEPQKNWCYYFEKASLYRQLKSWDKLSQITEEVLMRRIKPNDSNEWLPFIEGLIISKKYTQAEDLITGEILSSNSQVFKENICKMLQRLQIKEIKIKCQ